MTLAWEIAALTRGAKGLPNLDTLLIRSRSTAPRGASRSAARAVQRGDLVGLAEHYGLRVEATRLVPAHG